MSYSVIIQRNKHTNQQMNERTMEIISRKHLLKIGFHSNILLTFIQYIILSNPDIIQKNKKLTKKRTNKGTNSKKS